MLKHVKLYSLIFRNADDRELVHCERNWESKYVIFCRDIKTIKKEPTCHPVENFEITLFWHWIYMDICELLCIYY